MSSDDLWNKTICNAIIKSARITIDRGFVLSAWVDLDYGGSGQSFGGFVLGGVGDATCAKHKEQPNIAAEFIVGVMQAGDVESWHDLPGKTIRVRRSEPGVSGMIVAIGHIVREDRWFNPTERFAALSRHGGGA